MLRLALLVLFLTLSCLYDFMERRIPNEITYTMFIVGLLCAILSGGWTALKVSILGVVSAIILLTLLGNVFRLGAGDIKLMLACSAWSGQHTPYFVFFTFLTLVLYNLSRKAKNSPKELTKVAKMELLYGYNEPSEKVPGAFFITAGYLITAIFL